jgi:small neutral amino acid transporter SnatA (MarC family)
MGQSYPILLPRVICEPGKARTKGAEAMNLQILPLAITMMAGPQIMSAIIFITASKPLKLSASFIAGVAIATRLVTSVAADRCRGPSPQ